METNSHKGYDRLTPFYDYISKLVFGKNIILAGSACFDQIKLGDRVLIIGGGTGAILESLPSDFQGTVIYLDISKKMIERTKNRKNTKKYKIDYVCEDFINFDSPHKFEVIVTPFFLDLFPFGEINSIFQKISALLVVNGKWLVADFTMPTNNFFQKALIKIMYAFFKMTTHIKANDILDYKRMIMEQNYDLEKYKEFYSSMIFSAAFKKR